MNGETVVTVLVIVFVAGMFTDFFGLGSLITNRGSWYLIMADELETVMANLVKMNAFKDSDGSLNNVIKVRAYQAAFDGTVYYQVRIPDWVFKYQAAKLDDKAKADLLGVKLK